MLSGKDKKIFRHFSTRIRERFPHARIWAYGSRVNGYATDESDLDVCVVVDTLDDAIDQAIMKIAWEIGFENDVVISTVTYSKQETVDKDKNYNPQKTCLFHFMSPLEAISISIDSAF